MSTNVEQPPSNNGEFSNYLGFTTIKSEKGELTAEIEIADYLLNAKNIVHGGVLATLIDNIMGDTIATTVKSPVVTIDLTIKYLTAASKGMLTAKGNIIQKGHKIATAEGIIYNEHGQMVAKGTGTFKIIREKS